MLISVVDKKHVLTSLLQTNKSLKIDVIYCHILFTCDYDFSALTQQIGNMAMMIFKNFLIFFCFVFLSLDALNFVLFVLKCLLDTKNCYEKEINAWRKAF